MLAADDATWLERAAALSAKGDPRGELVRVQLALETAQGPELRRLLLLEEEILSQPSLAVPRSAATLVELGWRRGYIDKTRLSDFRSHDARSGEPDMSPLHGALAANALQFCRRLDAPRAVPRLPSSLEALALQQAVISPRLLALPRLRELHVGTVVSSVPLRHASLAHLSLVCRAGSVRALETAELPALETLALSTTRGSRDAPTFRPEDIGRLGVPLILDAPLVSQGRQWSCDELAALGATAKIIGLALSAGAVGMMPELPHLRRLRFGWTDHGGYGPVVLPPFANVEELSLDLGGAAVASREPFAALKEFPSLPNLRALHIATASTGVAEILAGNLERLETLSIIAGDTRFDMLKALLCEDALPALRCVALEHPLSLNPEPQRGTEGLSAAPCASRLETILVKMRSADDVGRWHRARPAFPKLKKLIVRGWSLSTIPAAARAELYELGHEVEWDPGWEPSRHFFRPDRVGVAHGGS